MVPNKAELSTSGMTSNNRREKVGITILQKDSSFYKISTIKWGMESY